MSSIRSKISDYQSNCSLVAMKNITGFDDEKIIKTAIENGYMPDEGMHTFKTFGIEFGDTTNYHFDRITINQFVRTFSDAVYLVYTEAHVFVIAYGKIFDTGAIVKNKRTRIQKSVKVLNSVIEPIEKKQLNLKSKIKIMPTFWSGIQYRKGQFSKLSEVLSWSSFMTVGEMIESSEYRLNLKDIQRYIDQLRIELI